MRIATVDDPAKSRHVAVIGSGISGLAAALLIGRTARVTLFEQDDRPGGHAHTVDVPGPRGPVAVDTGFIVYNDRNYPNLTALFEHLDVPTKPSDMSFAVSMGGGRLEYSGGSLSGLLGQRRNAVRPRFWRMLRDTARFYREAPGLLARPELEMTSVGAFLDQSDYSTAFVEDHLMPMAAAIWSSNVARIRAYPLHAFIRFFASHGLLSLNERPQWRTVDGGSREYVGRLLAEFSGEFRRGVGVAKVRREDDHVTITDRQGNVAQFSDVVIATHADQALEILEDADPMERELLGAFGYTSNRAVLHSDRSLMPRRERVWSSWNYIGNHHSAAQPLCVSYWMNQLQGIDASFPLFLTLNPPCEVDEKKLHGIYEYSHPLFDAGAMAAQKQIWQLQGRRRSWFCGAYFGSGFHEDGVRSGIEAAESLTGVRRPWISDADPVASSMMAAE